MPHYLESVIHPQSIAVIGASNDTAKRGHRAIKSLLADRYQGRIYPVNPKESEVLGMKCYPNVGAIPEKVDLVLVCTAAKTTPQVIEMCGQAGAKGAVLLAGGFSEASEAGRILEDQSIEIARQYGVRVIGPNTNGMFSSRLGCNAIGTLNIPRGPIAVLSNSANIMSSLQNEFIAHGHSGISVMLSVGNQSDIRFDEYLDLLSGDDETKSVILYVEGFKDAPAFMASARRITAKKPIVMYVAGRNTAGKNAAKSHSGSLAGDYAISKGVLKQAGISLVSRSDELFPVAESLALMPPMRGRRVAILSEGGGPITVASESCADHGLELALLSEATQARIHAIVPAATAIANPVDAGGGTDPRATYYGSISEAILQDPNIDALLFVGLFGGYGKRWGAAEGEIEEGVCRKLGEMAKTYQKPILVQSHFAHMKTASLNILWQAGIPYQRHIEIAVQCLASASDYYSARNRISGPKAADHAVAPAARELLRFALAAGRDLLEPEARALLKIYGINTEPHVLIAEAKDAASAQKVFGDMPVAVKIVSKDVLHKSEAGGVKLNVSGSANIARAVQEIGASVARHVAGAEIHGYLITPMVKRGTELLIGVLHDPAYGPVITFGLGGIFVEIIRDVVFRSLPIDAADAWEMVNELHHGAMLDGARGNPPVDRQQIVDLLLQVSAIATLHPEISEIDLNPIVAHADGCSIVDARVILITTNRH